MSPAPPCRGSSRPLATRATTNYRRVEADSGGESGADQMFCGENATLLGMRVEVWANKAVAATAANEGAPQIYVSACALVALRLRSLEVDYSVGSAPRKEPGASRGAFSNARHGAGPGAPRSVSRPPEGRTR